MNLTNRSELNNLQVRLNLWQLLKKSWAELSSVYLQSLVERMPRVFEAVRATKGGHFDEAKDLKKFFLFFGLICIFQEDLYLV